MIQIQNEEDDTTDIADVETRVPIIFDDEDEANLWL